MESGGGNGLREPNQNGSEGSGGRNVPLTVSSVSSPLGPTSVTRSPIRSPWVCGALAASAISPGPGGSPLNSRWASAPSRKSSGTDGPSSPLRRTVVRPCGTMVPTGSDDVASVIDASASSHGNSPSPYAWIRTFATVTAAPWTAVDRIADRAASA